MGKFDEIFDDVVVNAKACASAVSQKASTVYDVSKHKITAAEIRGDINKKLRELGALTYKSEVHGTDNSHSNTLWLYRQAGRCVCCIDKAGYYKKMI